MLDRQLELGLANARPSLKHRQQRQNRARWWFDRMRQAVDRALDWQPIPPARPEQTWLPTGLRLGPVNSPAEPMGAKGSREFQERHMSA